MRGDGMSAPPVVSQRNRVRVNHGAYSTMTMIGCEDSQHGCGERWNCVHMSVEIGSSGESATQDVARCAVRREVAVARAEGEASGSRTIGQATISREMRSRTMGGGRQAVRRLLPKWRGWA